MPSHFIEYYDCGKHIKNQCRCPGPDKQRRVSKDKCPHKLCNTPEVTCICKSEPCGNMAVTMFDDKYCLTCGYARKDIVERVNTLEAALREIRTNGRYFMDREKADRALTQTEGSESRGDLTGSSRAGDRVPATPTQTEETFDSGPPKTDDPNYTCNYQRATEETPR